MKILSLMLILMVISGCVFQNTDVTDIKKATQACEAFGGVKVIMVYSVGSEYATCVNGDEVDLKDVILRQENLNGS